MTTKTRSIELKALFAAILAVIVFVLYPLTGCTIATPEKETVDMYTVTFDSNGGSAVRSQEVKKGGYIVEPKDPVKRDNAFGGWYKDAKLSVGWSFEYETVNADMTLYAMWLSTVPVDEQTYFTVTFNSNGGSKVAPKNVANGGNISAPTVPTKKDSIFGGWYADSACTSPWDFNSDAVRSNITLYAKWTAIGDVPGETEYTVTFDTDGGSAVATQKVKSGSKVEKPADPTKQGNTFDGWYKDAKLTQLWIFNSNTVSANTTIYAKWTVDEKEEEPGKTEYTVSFNSNGGSSVSSKTVTSGEKVPEPAAPTREGHVFCGWYADTACTNEWDFNVDEVNSNMLLHAKWVKEEEKPAPEPVPAGQGVTATFNVGLDARMDGTYNPAAQSVKSGSIITEPEVTRSGYALDGWYVEGGSQKWNFNTDKLSKNTTLFAKWTSGGGTAVEYTPTMTNVDTLYIHYLRDGGGYSDWSAWVWTTGEGKKYAVSSTDKSGAIYAIKLSDHGNPSYINFIIAIIPNSGSWTKDGADNKLVLSEAQKVDGSYHWYIRENHTGDGSDHLTSGGGTSAPVKTEGLRASAGNVDRSKAQNLPKASTASDCENMGVGYQIFVASFCDSNGDKIGDLQGIISKLDYLAGLNVDVLWLTPIQSSNSIHGYDCYDYYNIDPKFGTNADYRELVYKAHQKGIKVIMDLVVNHTSPQNEWFIKSKKGVIETVTYQDGRTAEVKYRDFYRWSNSGGNRYCSAGDGWYFYSSFGGNMPELNYDCQQVRDAMTDVAMYWMAYGLDGFRMDAIKHVYMWGESDDSGCEQGAPNDKGWEFNLTKNVEFFKEFNYNLKQKYPNCFLLGEQLCGDPTYVAPFYRGMDSLFDFETYYNLPGRIGSGNASAAANAFNSNANKYAQNRGDRAINSMISSNHDIPRLSYMVGGNTQQAKLYFAVTMTMPGLSWIYYGDEIGMNSTKDDDRNFRQPMKWTSNWANIASPSDIPNKGFDNGIASVADQQNNSDSLLYYVKSLTKLRNDYPALINGNATCSDNNGVLRIEVRNNSQRLVVYHNFTGQNKSVDGSGTCVFGSANLGAYGSVAFLQ